MSCRFLRVFCEKTKMILRLSFVNVFKKSKKNTENVKIKNVKKRKILSVK